MHYLVHKERWQLFKALKYTEHVMQVSATNFLWLSQFQAWPDHIILININDRTTLTRF